MIFVVVYDLDYLLFIVMIGAIQREKKEILVCIFREKQAVTRGSQRQKKRMHHHHTRDDD
jgi:hypothetical protein